MEQNGHETEATQATARTGKGRTKWIVAGSAALVALGGIGVAGAVAGGDGVGRYVMQAGMHHGGHFAGRGFGRALDAVDASAEQEERIWAIIDAARAELRPLMREFRDARGDIADLIGAETIDREAAESLRAEHFASLDEASRKVTAAILDAAEVLTPEQRATLAERFKEHRGGRRW